MMENILLTRKAKIKCSFFFYKVIAVFFALFFDTLFSQIYLLDSTDITIKESTIVHGTVFTNKPKGKVYIAENTKIYNREDVTNSEFNDINKVANKKQRVVHKNNSKPKLRDKIKSEDYKLVMYFGENSNNSSVISNLNIQKNYLHNFSENKIKSVNSEINYGYYVFILDNCSSFYKNIENRRSYKTIVFIRPPPIFC
ncbi:hypothetical protein [Chryseobacterium sp. T1]